MSREGRGEFVIIASHRTRSAIGLPSQPVLNQLYDFGSHRRRLYGNSWTIQGDARNCVKDKVAPGGTAIRADNVITDHKLS